MLKESGYVLKLSLSEEEKQQLDSLTRKISDAIGVEVNMSWLLRTLVRLTLHGPEKPSVAESHVLLQMYNSAVHDSGIDGIFQLR
jgi:hypothetical protein